jgi:hypothetical protein
MGSSDSERLGIGNEGIEATTESATVPLVQVNTSPCELAHG